MSTSTPPTTPPRLQFRLRSLLIFMSLVAFIGAVYGMTLRAEESRTPMIYGERLRTLYAFGGSAWAVKRVRLRGIGGWRLVLCGAACGGALATMAYAPLSLPEARASDVTYRPAQTRAGPSWDALPIWRTAADLTLRKGLFAGALIGAATASLTFLSRIGARRFGELKW